MWAEREPRCSWVLSEGLCLQKGQQEDEEEKSKPDPKKGALSAKKAVKA